MRRNTTEVNCQEDLGKNKELQAVLLDSVAHELRTPLTSIIASVSALLTNSRLTRSQRDELLVVIDEEANYLNNLVGEALETAQLCVARLDLKSHGIQEIINAAGRHCNKLIGRHPISGRLSPRLMPVRADLNRITKALAHLLENAIKYSPPEKPITITAELNGNFVVTSVADCGCGIDRSEQDLIFKRFYRGKDHRSAIQGTGMGLPIANVIIRAHGGSLAVTSQPGQGSIFSFSLPIYTEYP